MTIEEINRLPFFFILGRGRSGTTLLQSMLDANENVIIPFESRLIIHLKTRYGKVVTWNHQLIEAMIDDLYKDHKFAVSWNVNKQELTDKLKSFPLEKLNFQNICKIIYLSFLFD